MNLLLVRHGVAEPAGPDVPDDQRALTSKGRHRMEQVAEGLARLVGRPDVLASSPLVRARQTADVLAQALGDPPRIRLAELEPLADPAAAAAWLARRLEGDFVVMAGHEPHLSRLASLLACGRDGSVVRLRKGAALLLETGVPPAAGGARIEWLLQPDQSRRIR